MKKILLFIFIFLISLFQPVFAEKIPVKMTLGQILSTHHDEIEIGDWINFTVINDIYVKDKLYIKKGTPISGFVDFLHQNGWAGDSAEIKIKTFETEDVNGEKVVINYPLDLDGNSSKNNDIKQYLSWKIIAIIRGSEIYIEPDTKAFNIFIER